MTLTLRPVAPEQHTPGGGRSRAYDICDNARPVGAVQLAAHRPYGFPLGRIERLSVYASERRRGRATAAALAAEEVLRGWRCVRVEVTLPEPAEPARTLAVALGYSERSHVMVQEQPSSPPLPSGSVPREMTEAEYSSWRQQDVAHSSDVFTARGVPPGQARTLALRELDTMLPDGPDTPGMALCALEHDGVVAGGLWLRTDGAPRPVADAWVYAVEVRPSHRGRGHGRTLMMLAERECHAAGRSRIGLHVQADNIPARRLYGSLGYRTSERVLTKALD